MPQKKKPDPRIDYADIIDLPRPEPSRPRMPLYKRAAQFAPFAALSGYDDMIKENNRMTEVSRMRELDELETEMLNQELRRLDELTKKGHHPTALISFYEPDVRKAGGRYLTVTDAVKRVDSVSRTIELMSLEGILNKSIRIERISRIRLEDEDAAFE